MNPAPCAAWGACRDWPRPPPRSGGHPRRGVRPHLERPRHGRAPGRRLPRGPRTHRGTGEDPGPPQRRSRAL